MNANNALQTSTHAACVINEVTICTVAYDAGWWIFAVPGEGSRRVIDSRQARALVGMLMNPWGQVDPEDVDDWAEFGPCVIRHVPIPASMPAKDGDADAGGDTSGDDEPDGPRELDDPEDGKDPGLSRITHWQSSLDADYWAHVHGVQSRCTGTIGDERVVRDIDRSKASVKSSIALLESQRRVPAKKVAEMKAMLDGLQYYHDQYVRSATGKDATGKGYAPHYRLFYPKATENLVKRIRTMLLRAIRTSFDSDSMASLALFHAINRGTRLGYEPDPRWQWQVQPFDRKSLPRLGKQADKGMAAA